MDKEGRHFGKYLDIRSPGQVARSVGGGGGGQQASDRTSIKGLLKRGVICIEALEKKGGWGGRPQRPRENKK